MWRARITSRSKASRSFAEGSCSRGFLDKENNLEFLFKKNWKNTTMTVMEQKYANPGSNKYWDENECI